MKRSNRVVIVQCRLSSSRLPGKALYDLCGSPVLAWCLRSMKKVPADKYFVATDKDSFDALEPICREEGFECFAGPLENVLERFCLVIKKAKAETVIRATADNPFLFYEAACESADYFDSLRGTPDQCDYFTFSGLPHGSGVEIFDGNSLLKAAELTDDPYDKEHVGPALYRHTDNFKCVFQDAPERFYAPDLRTTIDTYQDYLRAFLIAQTANPEIFSVSKQNPEKINFIPFTTEEIKNAALSQSVVSPLVIIPSIAAGRGTGHLVRCLKLAKETSSFIYVPLENNNEPVLAEARDLIQKAVDEGLNPNYIVTENFDIYKKNDFSSKNFHPIFLCDYFEIQEDMAAALSEIGTLIALDALYDEKTESEKYFDYIIDVIPSLKERKNPNLRNMNFMDLPYNRKNPELRIKNISEVKKIIVCLGGEDPAGLTVPVAESLSKVFPQAKIEAVLSNLNKKSSDTVVEYKNLIPNLREKLFEYDLVFTHYGLTAYEASCAGCGVVLLPTTALHEKLSEKYGFAHLDKNALTFEKIGELFKNGKVFASLPFSEEQDSLSAFVRTLSGGTKLYCPICGKTSLPHKEKMVGEVVSRNAERTYRRCPECGLVYISWTNEGHQRKYEKEYFFEQYKNQYGKTYQEDFEFIKANCKKRIEHINSVMERKGTSVKKTSPSVLDIGCAYGPFLKAASEANWTVYGTDICDDAVKSVQNDLHFPACVSAFPDINVEKEFGVTTFDAVTMWFVIEHFQDLFSVLSKVNSILKKGGVFAFSTPSGEGISAVSDKESFYLHSPTDHYSVWEPSKASKILQKFGFRIVKVVSTGHHPERFPSIQASGCKKNSLKWKLTDKVSRVRKLGDTVEIYCVKM